MPKKSIIQRFSGFSAIAAFAAALALVEPALAGAEPATGVQLSTSVAGTTVNYQVEGVPNRGSFLGVPIPGECTAVLADVVKSAPVLAPAVVDTISSRDIDAGALIQELVAAGAVAAGPRVSVASSGTATGVFTEVPRGVYIAVTICNISIVNPQFDPELFAMDPVVVADLGPGSSGSSAPGSSFGSAIGIGNGSSSGSGNGSGSAAG